MIKKRGFRFFLGKKSFLVGVVLVLNFLLFMLFAQSWVSVEFLDSLVLLPNFDLSAAEIFPVLSALVLVNFVTVFVAIFSGVKSSYFYFGILLLSVLAILFFIWQIISNVEYHVKDSELFFSVGSNNQLVLDLNFLPFITFFVAFLLLLIIIFSFFVLGSWKKNNRTVTDDNNTKNYKEFDAISTWDALSSGKDPT